MSTTQLPPKEDETALQHVMRSCKNSITKCFGCIQTTDENVLIQYKLYLIETRKKAFGVAYLNAVKEQGSEEVLKGLVNEALADIEKVQKEIEVLQTEIDRVNHVTKEKIVVKPGSAAATATAAATTAGAATAATTTTPATSPATSPTATSAAAPPAPVAATPAPVAPETTTTTPTSAPETTTTDVKEPDMEEVNLTSTTTTTAPEETKPE